MDSAARLENQVELGGGHQPGDVEPGLGEEAADLAVGDRLVRREDCDPLRTQCVERRSTRARASSDGETGPVDEPLLERGVALDTVRPLAEAGAEVMVAGSAVFAGGPEAYGRNMAALRDAALGTMA